MNASNLSQPSRLFRSLTKRGLILVVALAVLAQLVVLAWYRGLIPCFEGQERACLRDALNLWVLPSGLTITASGIDDSSIRRYAFDAEVELPPHAVAMMLSGRPFTSESCITRKVGPLSRTIPLYPGFMATESYSWHHLPPSSQRSEPELTCKIHFNATRDRAFIQSVAE